MPANEIAFPVGATNVRLVDADGEEYPIVVGTDTFTRTGKDGAEVVLPLFHGDEFVGKVLEGYWKKGWDIDISAFIAKIASGQLQLSGKAAVAGTWGQGWINSQIPLALLDGLQLTFEMEVPINDTGATPDRDIEIDFFLKKFRTETAPDVDTDGFYIGANIDEDGLVYQIYKIIGSAWTKVWEGSDYNKAARSPTADMFTIWRLVFSGRPGTAGAHVHVYLKQGSSRANALAATENEITDSPLDLSDLKFHVAYPSWLIWSQNTTYFADANEASTGIQVVYPDFDVRYSLPDANEGLGDVKVYDTMGSVTEADWQRVLDPDHVFVGDAVLQNGLIRLYADGGAQYGLKLYYYSGAAWTVALNKIYNYLVSGATDLVYPQIRRVESITPERIILILRLTDTASDDADYYADVKLTLSRGSYKADWEITAIYPADELRFIIRNDGAGDDRWAYAGDTVIGDADLAVAAGNATMSDNFGLIYDDAGVAALAFWGANKKPDGTLKTMYAGTLSGARDYLVTALSDLKVYIGAMPFSLIVNLFKESESATISGAARLYMDGDGEDTVTENSGKWAATTNCAKDENDAVRVSVGSKDVKITSSAAGAVLATCTPAAPLGKLTKFDYLKVYLSRSGAAPASVKIRLRKDSGKYVEYTQAITASAVQYTIPLPHSASDLQGWTQTGTMDFAGFADLTIGWTAVGSGEIVYVDGLHEYIGTTTARGRGETLSNGSAVVLDAQNENFYYALVNALTKLPAGRYLFVCRTKDTDQVANDLSAYVKNAGDNRFKNENNAVTYMTLTSSFAFYSIVFDLDSGDSGDNVNLNRTKSKATENTIFVDYVLIVPVGNGQDWPQDLTHAALRTMTKARKVVAV
jgi:hypothetical protein